MSIADQMPGFSWEKRPLKRPRLGPPDLYPQDPKQREDELTAVNVKQGFSHMPQLSDEFGTMKNGNISAAKLGVFINGAISKKIELNALPDTGKRRLQVNTKDHFWHVTPRHKQVLEAWMKDLAGAKPLSAIAKKVPIFNKREEIFLILADHQVPMVRAAWFLKMTASYNSAISEAKTKKRQMPDPSQEWTSSLSRCCKEILARLTDWYNGVPPSTGGSTPNSGTQQNSERPNMTPNSSQPSATAHSPSIGSSGGSTPGQTSGSSSGPGSVPSFGSTMPSAIPPAEDGSLSLKQWLYCTDLAKHLYEEGLLDRPEWLRCTIDMCEKTKSLEDGAWKALMPILLSFLPHIAQSESLSRYLATVAARRLSSVFSEQDLNALSPVGNTFIAPPQTLVEYLQCATHRTTVLGLVSTIQVITLECPTALVYNSVVASVGENGKPPWPGGSALDMLPVQPSVLPMPPRANNHIVRTQLKLAELQIMNRSRAVEAKWSCEEWQQSSAGATLQKVLSALDALDRHFFDRTDNGNTLEDLYAKIFPIPPVKENPSEADAPIVLLLCQWAVGPHRLGEHRPLTVARLLEHRQTEATNATDQNDPTVGLSNGNGGPISENGSKNGNTSGNENLSGDDVAMNGTDSEGNGNSNNGNGTSNGEINNGSNSGSGNEDEPDAYTGLPIYHNLLFTYLDSDAPTLDESSPQSKATFAALVNLFSALIRHDIFSHDAYLCTLVARGDLSAVPQIVNPTSVQPIQSEATPGPGSHPGPGTPASVSSVTPGATPLHDNLMDDRGSLFPPLPRMQEMPRQPDYDDRNIDDDLDRILQHITQEQQNNMDQIDSPKDEHVAGAAGGFGSMTSGHQQPSSNSNSTDPNNASSNVGRNNSSVQPQTQEISKQSRHRLFVTHFPLPQDDTYQHEANQRHILLYGVGRARDEARHVVKKVSKDLGKLFSKKFCYDIADGSRVKKHSKNEINLEGLQSRFNSLPYFDQHSVTAQTALGVLEMLATFASARSNYLPTVEHIAYLSELMELCLNINCLVETCVQILRELPDIESQLKDRSSPIVVQYVTSLQLQLVAVLRRYQCCLLLDSELTTITWDSLTRIMRRLVSPTECSSSERCTLAYLNELQSCSGLLRTKNINDYLPPVAAKLRQSLSSPVQPSDSSHNWNHTFMTSCLDNPRRKENDSQIYRQLVESPACRYSFVCNSVLSICNEADAERLNDLASLCADMTAACPLLAPEWLGVLQTLCTPSRHVTSYADILTEVDVKHLSIHSSLATLTSLLVARHCFSLQDFVVQAVPSLLKAWNEGRGPNDPDTEAGARLTCALLLSLFKTQDNINPSTTPSVLKLICDRRLLSATHNSITLGAVLAVLKAMLLLADAAGLGGDRRRDQRPTSTTLSQGELSISHILGTTDVPSSTERADAMRGESRTLASFAYASLQQMCGEPWVRQRCLQNPDDLCNADMLLDPIVSPKQAQRLLQLICYPEVAIPEETLDARTHIPKIMENLDQWNLREAWLALTLQNKQLTGIPIDHQTWLDIVARSALEVFHLGSDDGHDYILPHSATPSPAPGKSPRSGKKGQDSQIARTPPSAGNNHNSSSSSGSSSSSSEDSQQDKNASGDAGNEGNICENKHIINMTGNQWTVSAAWLIAPLVAKLPGSVQGRVLRHAGNVLENTLWPKKSRGKPPTVRGGSLHAHLPFLALVLTCLRGQDEQREGLLASLLTQFTQLLSYAKDPHVDSKSDALRDALRLRLSLVGGMFDAIQRSSTATQEWAVVLTQLVTHGVVDVYTNPDVFPTVVDMVASLVHSTQITEPGDRIEEMKKQNMNLVKKLKKEMTDRDGDSIKPIRQLLPFSKVQCEVIVCQATSIITDSKGNRVQSFEFVDKKPGLQVWEKQRVSPWEVIEGQRNPAALSWAWFGAVKMERKPLRYEEAHRLLKYHAHSLVKSASHFLEPVPLPPEEIDVKPEIPIKEEIIMIKPETPLSDQSPRGANAAGKNKTKAPRRKRQTKAQQQQAQAAAAAQQQQQQAQQVQINSPAAQPPIPNTNAVRKKDKTKPNASVGSPYGAPGPTPLPPGPNQPPPNYPPGPPPQWYNGNQQQTYYPPQPVPGPGGRPPQLNNPKQALHNLLRQRQPGTGPATVPLSQFQQFPQGQPPGPRHQILRSQLRGQTPGPIPAQGFQGQTMPTNPTMYQPQQMQSQGTMSQNYAYNQPSINSQQGPTPGMMTPQQQQMNQIMGPRGPVPVQEMSGFMNSGAPSQVPVRTMGQRPQNFMQGNPQTGPQGNPGIGSMQGGYGRPPMGQMGQPSQMVQGMNTTGQMPGMPNPGQMGQSMQPGMQNPGQMTPQGMTNQVQMGQPGISQSQIGQPGMPNPGQMGQPGMQNTGQMGQPGMQNPGQMGQPGMQNPGQMGQPGMQNPGQMGQPGMQNPGQMGQPGMPNTGQMGQPGMQNAGQMGQPGMPHPGQMGQPGMQNTGQMGQPGMQNPGQMGQPGMQNPGQMGQPGMPNSGQMGQPGMVTGPPNMPNNAQRLRQMMALQQQQQQQQQQQNMGMGSRGPMNYPNQPGGY